MPSRDAVDLLPEIDRLVEEVEELRHQHKSFDFSLVGLPIVAAKANINMITQLNQSLLLAIAMVVLVTVLSQVSILAGLKLLLPNCLPIVLCGALLYFLGWGLQFTSVLAFTVGFGIAVDNSIHMLTRFLLEKKKSGNPPAAVVETARRVGPVLVVGALVFIAGLGATTVSQLPTVQLFGQVSIALILAALVTNLTIMPATLALAAKEKLGHS